MPLPDAPNSQYRGGRDSFRHGRQEQVRSAHEPTGDFSLSLTRMACQCCHSARRSDWSMDGQTRLCQRDRWDVMDVMAGSRKSFSRQNPVLWTRRYNAEPRHRTGAALLTGPVVGQWPRTSINTLAGGGTEEAFPVGRETQRRSEQLGDCKSMGPIIICSRHERSSSFILHPFISSSILNFNSSTYGGSYSKSNSARWRVVRKEEPKSTPLSASSWNRVSATPRSACPSRQN